ncbi:MAG: septum formation inhibitor Maf [Gammaproteobacteria bacterium]|nr:septum formation inhibitor Maf [Gammaproteobacteria bacterium]
MSGVALCLASRSPRRAELLRTLGVSFQIIDGEVDESRRLGEAAPVYVARLAQAKALAGQRAAAPGARVLAADTTVVVGGEILGKPLDRPDGLRMLSRLAGVWHEVYTAVVLRPPVGAPYACTVATRVRFRALRQQDIEAYWASGEPADKAGAYGIQGLGGALVDRIEGSYSNVVGLPLAETLQLLTAAGVAHALDPSPSPGR